MIHVESWLNVADDLVSVQEFSGPVADQDYIEGAIELTISHKPMLTRDMVDYVDQLWAYLIRGLEEVLVGNEFSTYYPDMPIQIIFRPQGSDVTVIVDPQEWNRIASVPLDTLVGAMTSAGTMFFDKLRQYAPNNSARYNRNISRLAALVESMSRSRSDH